MPSFEPASAAASATAGRDDEARGAVPAGWEEAWATLAPRLLLFARRWSPAPADAEDLVQEAFVRCWRRHGLRAAGEPALLFTAVRSAALDALRRDQRRQRREDFAAASHPEQAVPAFVASLEERERAEALARALARLPPEQHEVVTLRTWGGLSFRAVADVLGIPEDTAASRHRYALAALRRTLRADPAFTPA